MQLKRHILKNHANNSLVSPLLNMNSKDQVHEIVKFQKQEIRKHFMVALESGSSNFMQGKILYNTMKMLIMCSKCLGFFATSYKACHQLVCPASVTTMLLSLISCYLLVSVQNCKTVESFCEEFKGLMNSLLLDVVGNYTKTGKIVLMIGWRSFRALRRKKDKLVEAKRSFHERMRLITRDLFVFLWNL